MFGNYSLDPQVGFKLETNCFQFYVIANLDKTSLINISPMYNAIALDQL